MPLVCIGSDDPDGTVSIGHGAGVVVRSNTVLHHKGVETFGVECFGDRTGFMIDPACVTAAGENENCAPDFISRQKIGGHVGLKIIFGIAGAC